MGALASTQRAATRAVASLFVDSAKYVALTAFSFTVSGPGLACSHVLVSFLPVLLTDENHKRTSSSKEVFQARVEYHSDQRDASSG